MFSAKATMKSQELMTGVSGGLQSGGDPQSYPTGANLKGRRAGVYGGKRSKRRLTDTAFPLITEDKIGDFDNNIYVGLA